MNDEVLPRIGLLRFPVDVVYSRRSLRRALAIDDHCEGMPGPLVFLAETIIESHSAPVRQVPLPGGPLPAWTARTKVEPGRAGRRVRPGDGTPKRKGGAT